MEPKDLKNSEELNSTKKTDLENSEINNVSEDEKNEVKTPQTEPEIVAETVEDVEAGKEEKHVEITPEEVAAESEEKTEALIVEKEDVDAEVVEEKKEEQVTDSIEAEEAIPEKKEQPEVIAGKVKEEPDVVEEILEEKQPEKQEEKVEELVAKSEEKTEASIVAEEDVDAEVVEKKNEEPVTDPVKAKDAKPEKKELPEVIAEEEKEEPEVVVESVEEKEPEKIEEQVEAVVSESEEKKEALINKKEDVDSEVVEEPVAELVETEDTLPEKDVQPEVIPEEKKDQPEVDAKTVEEKEPEKKEEKVEAVISESEEVDKEKQEEKKPTSEKRKKHEVIKDIRKPKPKKEVVDYSIYSQIELVNALRDVLDSNGDHDIKEEVEVIKSVFYKNLNENIDAAKKKFIDEGGNEEEFKAEEDPYENDIKDLLYRYRQIRIEFNKKLEHIKEDNLKLKYEVIEGIKGLINNEESINKTFNDFRDLQHEWREIGLVPQSKMKNLWDTYHFHVENFYDYIKINRELRDLDLRKNLEIKIKLCESAEELLVEPSIIKAFNTLQKYHERWREVGPVPREQKDDIWERFKAATSKINKKHQEFFESRKDEQKKNLEAKTALCEKVEELDISTISNYKEWDEKSKELIQLQKVWRTIGFAPKKDNNKIYERFRNACDNFFNAKREFYAKNKELQQNNLQEKIDLCVQAESLKDNTDWKKTTQDFISIQRKWKEIGPIPRKHSDSVWKRFRAACDHFFDKKSEHFSGMDSEQIDNLKKKEELVEKIINFKSTGDVNENLNSLKEFQREWTEIGHVPFKSKDEIQNKFREAINKLYDELNIDDEKRNILKFRSKMSSYSESNRGQNKMRMERDKYMNKLKQLESDHVLLENNIGFFAKSKNAESLIEDVKKKIEVSKQKIQFLKEKIRVIDEMDRD